MPEAREADLTPKAAAMSLSVIHTRALVGLHAPEVVVEVHLANGLPSFTLVGLADVEVKEALERVRAALSQSGFAFPHNKKVTVNLAPSSDKKVGSGLDLAIAIGVLIADEQLLSDDVQPAIGTLGFIAELGLDGSLRAVPGMVPLVAALAGLRPVVADASHREAMIISDEPVGTHQVMSRADYEVQAQRQDEYIAGREMIIIDGFIGNDPQYRTAARVGRKWPRRWTRITASQSSSDILAIVRSRRMPALLTRASRPPNSPTAVETSAAAAKAMYVFMKGPP